MYVDYNPNPAGKRVGDCVIRALCKLTGKDWETTYFGVAMEGFRLYDMPSSNNVWGKYIRGQGFKKKVLPDTCPDCYTVRDFAREHKQGQYLLATGSHVVAVVDGDYYDSWDSGDEVPAYYFEKGD
jgi:hypothetical protein